MHQEAVFVLAGQRINALRIALGTQCGHDQRLRLAAREQRGAVGARQHRVADFDRTHSTCVTAVNARLAGQNLAAHDARFDIKQHAFNLDTVERDAVKLQIGHHDCVGFAAGAGAGLLVADLVSRSQFVVGNGANLGDQCFVLGWSLPVPSRLAGVTHQFVDGIDGDIALLMTKDHSAEHDFFAQLLGFRFHHQHSSFGTGNHQIQNRILARGLTGIEHVLTVDVANAGGADRATERDAADGQGRANSDQGGDVGINFRIERQGVHHNVHFVEKTFGEQRADRTVDQSAGQCLEFAGATFALEKAAGNLASGIGLLKVIHRQGEKVLPGLAFGLADDCGQHHGAVHVEQHSAIGLTCDFTGFHGDGVLTPLEGLRDFVEYAHLFLLVNVGSAGHFARARIWHHRTRCHSREIRFEPLWNDTASLRYCLLRSKKRLS